MVAGVAGGLAPYLGVDVLALRLALVVLTAANGLGLILYALAWVLLPERDEAPTVRPRTPDRMVGLALLTVGTVWIFGVAGLLLQPGVAWAVTLGSVGFALVWARTDGRDRTRGLLVRAAGGGLLLVLGFGVLFSSGGFLEAIGKIGLAVLATGVAVALLLSPWIIGLARDLAVERRERIRSEERSEIAAHLHDSVLQTLALIQRADQPGRAKALAARQERELRAWLFDERPPEGEGRAATLGAALEAVVTDVEAEHDIEVDLVVVGDRDPSTRASTRWWRRCGRPPTTPPGTPTSTTCPSTWRSAIGRSPPTCATEASGSTRTPSRTGAWACGSPSSAAWPATEALRRSTRTPGEGTEVVLELEWIPVKETAR